MPLDQTSPLVLMLLGDQGSIEYPLPQSGTIVIGRDPTCDVAADESALSRRHAAIHIAETIEVEDLGSSNGTIVRSAGKKDGTTARLIERVAEPGTRVPVGAGDVICLGSAVVLLRPGAAPPPHAARGKPRAPDPVGAAPIVIVDPEMKRLHDLAAKIARGDIGVLIMGETGTGKEIVAEAIHRASPRASAPLLRINCASLSEVLLESELLGYERGAFTGANKAKPGLLQAATGGTVMLDEVGELLPSTQAKLLRVMEDQVVYPLGSVKPYPIDVRFIAATNRDLQEQVAAGSFRRDLYYRINGATLIVPPLRERPSEILPLAREFARRASARLGGAPPELSPAACEWLRAQTWPGNIRELRNLVERAVLLCGEDTLEVEHLAAGSPPPPPDRHAADAPRTEPPLADDPSTLRDDMVDLERQRIIDALQRCGGNQTRAAKELGIPRRTLVRRLAEYSIPRPRKS